MAKTHIEPVNGGLVTARPAILLNQGELTEAAGVYRPFSQSLWNPPANASFATLTGTLTGLRYCGFDYRTVRSTLTSGNATVVAAGTDTYAGISVGALARGAGIPAGATVSAIPNSTTIVLSAAATSTDTQDLTIEADHVVLVQDGTNYKVAVASNTTGTFATVESSVAAANQLDSVAYNNQHVLLNGQHTNRVLLANRTTRAHGLQPVTVAPNTTTASGTWTAEEGAGFYSYWTTELDKTYNIESDFQGKRPAVVNVSTTSLKVLVTKPTTVNTTASHWRLYRSPKMVSTNATSAAAENIFPSGLLVGEAPITQLTIEDGGTISSSSALPAGSVGQAASAWANPSFATGAANGTVAVCSGATTAAQVLELGTFGITTASLVSPIVGIQVVVRAQNSAAAGRLYVQIKSTNNSYFTGGLRQSAQYEVPLTTSLANYTLGGPTDDWGLRFAADYGVPNNGWSPADFADGKFTVLLYGTPGGATVSVDSVTVSVSYGTTFLQGTVAPFPAVEVIYAGLTTAVGRNGPPPKATTGDMFQDSLVLNDVTQGNVIRYTFPGTLDYVPTPYFVNFNTQEQDVVTCIKAVGNALLVGMNGRLWRLTYLPREQDSEFDRGRAVELLDSERGIVGALAATRYTGADARQRLCFFSGDGLNTTDGYRIDPATNDIDFRNLIDPAFLTLTEVTNNPELYEIWLTYVPKGTSTKNGVLRFSYHPTHIKENGSLKCCAGSVGTMRAGQAGMLRTGTRVMYITDGVDVFRANQTPTSTVQIALTTRQISTVGLGMAQRIQRVDTHYTQYGYSAASGGTVGHTLRGHRRATAAATTDADYTRAASQVTKPLLAYPVGTSQNPKDAHYLNTPVNFGDTVISDRAVLNSTAGCHYSIDFLVLDYDEIEDEF